MAKNKKNNKYESYIRVLLSIFYLFIVFVLVYSAYQLFLQDQREVNWKDVKETDEYAFLDINQMSEAFAEIDQKQIHFVMEKETTGEWHTYLIAIDKKDYDKYKKLIDYTYERTEEKPEAIRVYGYPISINKKLKKLAIKNITNFIPVENEVTITDKNFEKYLTDTYLDTTIEKTHIFNNSILILLILALIMFIAFILAQFDKNMKRKNKNKKRTGNQNNKQIKSSKKEKSTAKVEKEKNIKSSVEKQQPKKNNKKDEEELEII